MASNNVVQTGGAGFSSIRICLVVGSKAGFARIPKAGADWTMFSAAHPKLAKR